MSPALDQPGQGLIGLSVVAPARNEEGNVEELVSQVERAVAPLGLTFEFIIVDDASTDGTAARAAGLCAGRPWLRCLRLPQRADGLGHGQSAAFHAGIQAARGRVIVTLDADLQNDPADIPRLLGLMDAVDMVQGDRTGARRDGVVRRAGSWVGRLFRRALLGDRVRDTGCSLRVMRRELARRLPLEFRGMHRFIPALARDMGYTVTEAPVAHRARRSGVTKYGLGIVQRAVPGLVDLGAVLWMRSRRRDTRPSEPDECGAGTRAGSAVRSAPTAAKEHV